VAERGRRRAGPDTPVAESGVLRAKLIAAVGEKLGIRTVRDLLFHLPRAYEDLRELIPAELLQKMADGDVVSARLQVRAMETRLPWPQHVGGGGLPNYTGFGGGRVIPASRTPMTKVLLGDETGTIEAVWFGPRFIERRIAAGDWLIVSGKIKRFRSRASLSNPDFELDRGGDRIHAGAIIPVYRLSGKLTAPVLRRAIRQALDRVGRTYPEYLPDWVAREASTTDVRLRAIQETLESAHFPHSPEARDAALSRLGFDELLALEIGMTARQRLRIASKRVPIPVSQARLDAAVLGVEEALGRQLRARGCELMASLTTDQRRAVSDIVRDLGGSYPMTRLLQGDVGSGKTAVAALALSFVADAGHQAALLAPTDLLARQHATSLMQLLEPLGHEVTILTGSLPAADRRAALKAISAPIGLGTTGKTSGRVVVGTHALLGEAVHFSDLALVVVDEQHRFGVTERAALERKGVSPHVLLMTATPIPRTLKQILLSDMDVSDLRSLPSGRKRIVTRIRRSDQLDMMGDDPTRGAYPLIVREIRAGHRAFVVVPLVENEPELAAASADDIAEALPARLRAAAMRAGLPTDPEPRIGVVHGQMKASERDKRMLRFREGDLDILVGTTVLEVGVDVPEATVMLILDADRYGLAQLHQLRGRVGRGEADSFCILSSDAQDQTAQARLKAVESEADGFKLAEMDLTLRREGQLLGFEQSGLPRLKVASLAKPEDLRRAARAREIAEQLVDDTGLLKPGLEALDAELKSGWLRDVGAGRVLADIVTDDEAPDGPNDAGPEAGGA
jgi:ATP-dependent DNA helicase RecG